MGFLQLLFLTFLVTLLTSTQISVSESDLDVLNDFKVSAPRVKRQFGWGPWWSYRPWGGYGPWFWRPYYGGGFGFGYGWG
ncbi:sulfur globule protein CV3 domain protein [Ancylostoma caninum]|uniref:Sulfur globule protein CV3 domain protein n=1 Tax=Ancylostoma caninum TaxID=29170 RepID=A0A368G3J9_ANCCA|nr:sulfur globule protein CV3 domain protein [Ancylostoma caninum]